MLILLAGSLGARAEYRLCNQTGYILDAALAIESAGATATQGWFRILPGRCSAVLSGGVAGERFFIHTRTPAFYGERPEAAEVSRMFCVRPADFLLPGAQSCAEGRGTLAPFTEVATDPAAAAATTLLTDGTGMSLDEARAAAISRLLAIAGYDPGLANGSLDARVPAALAAFAEEHGIADSNGNDEALFAALYKAAEETTQTTGTIGRANGGPAE